MVVCDSFCAWAKLIEKAKTNMGNKYLKCMLIILYEIRLRKGIPMGKVTMKTTYKVSQDDKKGSV
jgi:hypothetical protein